MASGDHVRTAEKKAGDEPAFPCFPIVRYESYINGANSFSAPPASFLQNGKLRQSSRE